MIRFGELASHNSNAAIFRSMNEQNPIILYDGVKEKSSFKEDVWGMIILPFSKEKAYY